MVYQKSYLISHSKFELMLKNPQFISHYFSIAELAECKKKGAKEQAALRGRWAAKHCLSSLLKEIGIKHQPLDLITESNKEGISWLINPTIRSQIGNIFISLSHEGLYSIAFVAIDANNNNKIVDA